MTPISREEIDRLIATGEISRARSGLARLWRESNDPATAAFVVSRFEKMRAHLTLTPCRLAILRSFTVEPVIPSLRAMAFTGGIDLEVRLGDFNTYVQDVLDLDGWLYRFSQDVVIVAVQTRDVTPTLWGNFADLDREGVEASVGATVEMFRQIVHVFRSRSAAHLVMHTLEFPVLPAKGLIDSRSDCSQMGSIAHVNQQIAALVRDARNAYVLDYTALIARHGESGWHDERKWLLARLPLSAGALIQVAREWMRFVHPITGRTCKVLAVDLDNTLWGGVIGEDGIDGIKLGEGYPGAAYRVLQRAILDLHRRGVILAICSKNNPADAMEAIEKHPGMLLRPEHFAAFRINWEDKATNLRAIAKELNVGIDSVAFLDDNPVEREWVREQVPEVTVIDLPTDPMRFARALRESPVFERLEITEEDQSRGRYYAEQRMRTELENSAASLEDFYRALEMRVRIEPVTPRSLTRAAQLTQKTNQFNLTTRRYTEQQLMDIIASPQSRAFTIQVTDRFGDNGIVGVAILRFAVDICEIDTFLLSCRVIGRTAETAFLATIAADAARHGATKLKGSFLPTKKNAPAADFFKRHGFKQTLVREGAALWELDLGSQSITCPLWIVVETRSDPERVS